MGGGGAAEVRILLNAATAVSPVHELEIGC
jgi:hypothetical protein